MLQHHNPARTLMYDIMTATMAIIGGTLSSARTN
jgi:hypothetical protein